MNLQRIEATGEFASDAVTGALGVVVGYALVADAVSVPVVGEVSGSVLGWIALVAVAVVLFANRRQGSDCGCC